MGCMVKEQAHKAKAQSALTCFVPDNKLRDDLFYCLMDEHDCIATPQDGPIYPTCRDSAMKGDASFAPANLVGDWWKVKGWTQGEPYETRPCSRVQFWPAQPPPSPYPFNFSTIDTNVISSTWLENDIHNKSWLMNDTSLFGPR